MIPQMAKTIMPVNSTNIRVKVRSHYVRLRVRLRVRISLRVRTTVTF